MLEKKDRGADGKGRQKDDGKGRNEMFRKLRLPHAPTYLATPHYIGRLWHGNGSRQTVAGVGSQISCGLRHSLIRHDV